MRPPVAPYLTVSPAMAAIAFYTTVFGAKQRALMPSFDGLRIMHCELSINGGSVMLADAFSEFGQTRVPASGRTRDSFSQPGICRGQDGGRDFREGDQSRRQRRYEPDEFVLGHQGRDVSRSLRSSLDLERAADLSAGPNDLIRPARLFLPWQPWRRPLFASARFRAPPWRQAFPFFRRSGPTCRAGRADNRVWRAGPCRAARP